MMDRTASDVLIVGAGAAGLFASLHLPDTTEVVVVDKGHKGQGSSPWAQGGVAAARVRRAEGACVQLAVSEGRCVGVGCSPGMGSSRK